MNIILIIIIKPKEPKIAQNLKRIILYYQIIVRKKIFLWGEVVSTEVGSSDLTSIVISDI